MIGGLEAVVARLEAAGCVAADDEAADYVALAPDDATLEAWLRRREAGEPSAWITGTLSFCGRPLHVDRGVFVPRDQTEELARRAAALFPEGWQLMMMFHGEEDVETFRREVRGSVYSLPWLGPVNADGPNGSGVVPNVRRSAAGAPAKLSDVIEIRKR